MYSYKFIPSHYLKKRKKFFTEYITLSTPPTHKCTHTGFSVTKYSVTQKIAILSLISLLKNYYLFFGEEIGHLVIQRL